MYQIDNSTAVTTQPASTAAGTAGYFTDGNSATGVPATILPAEWLNAVQDELIAIVNAGGLTPSKADSTQLLAAINAMISDGAVDRIQSVSASVASNALTVGYAGARLAFRAAALTSGVPVIIKVGALTLTVPVGATLGTSNGIAAQLALVVLYNGGSPVLGIVNLAGGVNLDETTLLSAAAISSSATSATTVYATSAVTSSPFRVIGYLTATEAAAGTWATAPTLVQGCGGQAMAAMQSLGFGQTMQDLTSSRAIGTTYYNTTGRPINVSFTCSVNTTGAAAALTVNGVTVYGTENYSTSASVGTSVSAIVPPGGSYVAGVSVGAVQSLMHWSELR